MSTDKYLESLDYDQLLYAKRKAQSLIDGKVAEKKVKLWQVSDGLLVHQSFYDSEYVQAARFLCGKAEELDRAGKHDRLELTSTLVFESEVKDYIEG